MALKLITQIKRYLDRTPPEGLEVQEVKELPNGVYYDFEWNKHRFCLVLQDFKGGLKVNWIFHNDLEDNELEYWNGRYDFKLRDHDRITKSHLQIQDIHNQDEVRVLMSRYVETLRIFTKDLRWIILMIRQRRKTR